MPRRQGPGHKSAMQTHAARRAAERHGLLDWPRTEIVAAIRARDPARVVFLARQSSSRSIWAVYLHGRSVPVVYNRRRGDIATVLPADWPTRHGYIILRAPLLGPASTGD